MVDGSEGAVDLCGPRMALLLQGPSETLSLMLMMVKGVKSARALCYADQTALAERLNELDEGVEFHCCWKDW